MLNGRKTTSTEELTKKIKAIADAQKLTGLSMVVVKIM